MKYNKLSKYLIITFAITYFCCDQKPIEIQQARDIDAQAELVKKSIINILLM